MRIADDLPCLRRILEKKFHDAFRVDKFAQHAGRQLADQLLAFLLVAGCRMEYHIHVPFPGRELEVKLRDLALERACEVGHARKASGHNARLAPHLALRRKHGREPFAHAPRQESVLVPAASGQFSEHSLVFVDDRAQATKKIRTGRPQHAGLFGGLDNPKGAQMALVGLIP